jgi:hypothetical protein
MAALLYSDSNSSSSSSSSRSKSSGSNDTGCLFYCYTQKLSFALPCSIIHIHRYLSVHGNLAGYTVYIHYTTQYSMYHSNSAQCDILVCVRLLGVWLLFTTLQSQVTAATQHIAAITRQRILVQPNSRYLIIVILCTAAVSSAATLLVRMLTARTNSCHAILTLAMFFNCTKQ